MQGYLSKVKLQFSSFPFKQKKIKLCQKGKEEKIKQTNKQCMSLDNKKVVENLFDIQKTSLLISMPQQ